MGLIMVLSLVEAILIGFVWESTFSVAILSAFLGANLMWLTIKLSRGRK